MNAEQEANKLQISYGGYTKEEWIKRNKQQNIDIVIGLSIVIIGFIIAISPYMILF